MDNKEVISVIFGTLNAAIFITSAVIAWRVYRQNEDQKAKDRVHSDSQKIADRAMELYRSLMTSEFLLRARLVCQEYLLEDPRSDKYRKYKGLDFDELDIKLRTYGDEKEKQDRFFIRAIPNFFHTVNLAWKQGYIRKDERMFSQIYAWYWVNILEERQVQNYEMFTHHSWMSTDEDIKHERTVKAARLKRLTVHGSE